MASGHSTPQRSHVVGRNRNRGNAMYKYKMQRRLEGREPNETKEIPQPKRNREPGTDK